MTCAATGKSTCSPASAAGATRCASPAGPTTDPSGPAPVPVSRFRALDSDVAMPISAISGPLFSASSPSADLQRSLASRLHRLLGASGSLEYGLTWSTWDMPAGLPICRLRASARRTSDSAFGGWQTPTTGDAVRGAYTYDGHDKTRPRLSNKGLVAGWATPRSVETGHSVGNPERALDHKSRLEDQVYLAGWATPTATDHRSEQGSEEWARQRELDRRGVRLSRQVLGANTTSSRAPTGGRGSLNPEFVRWLMGFPPEHLSCAPTATPSCRRSRSRSSQRLSEPQGGGVREHE